MLPRQPQLPLGVTYTKKLVFIEQRFVVGMQTVYSAPNGFLRAFSILGVGLRRTIDTPFVEPKPAV